MASITTRPGRRPRDARYDVRYRDADRTVRTRTFRREVDAKAFARQVETDLDRGEWVDPRLGRETFKDYARRWLEGRNLRPRTRDDYESMLERHLDPAFGSAPLAGIRTENVRTWHAQLQRRAPSRAAKCYRLLRAVLNTATDDGYIARNPCRIEGAGSEQTSERPLLSLDEVATIIDRTPDELRAFVVLAASCGLRVGELLALRRRHVDILHAVLIVDEQCFERADGTVEFGPPKTVAGRRRVAIPTAVVPRLEEHLERHVAPEPGGFLFTGSTGAPLRRRSLYTAWGVIRHAAGLPTAHLHDLRHHGATMAAQAGATTKELMARLGQSSPRAALIYQHAATERDRELAERIGSAMTAAKPAPVRAVRGLDANR